MITRQRHRRALPAGGRAAAPPRSLQPRGHRVGAGHGGHPGDAVTLVLPAVHHLGRRPRVHPSASWPSRRSPRWSLYVMFVFTQTVRHRDFFLPVRGRRRPAPDDDDATATPTRRRPGRRWLSLGLLVVALVAVVGLAKVRVARDRGRRSRRLGFPHAVVGVVIALLVLLPESIAAVRAAARPRADQPQPRLRLGDGLDRPHHPDHRRRLDLARRPARARPRADADRAAGALRRGRRADRRPGPRQAAPGRSCTWCCSRRSSSCRSQP